MPVSYLNQIKQAIAAASADTQKNNPTEALKTKYKDAQKEENQKSGQMSRLFDKTELIMDENEIEEIKNAHKAGRREYAMKIAEKFKPTRDDLFKELGDDLKKEDQQHLTIAVLSGLFQNFLASAKLSEDEFTNFYNDFGAIKMHIENPKDLDDMENGKGPIFKHIEIREKIDNFEKALESMEHHLSKEIGKYTSNNHQSQYIEVQNKIGKIRKLINADGGLKDGILSLEWKKHLNEFIENLAEPSQIPSPNQSDDNFISNFMNTIYNLVSNFVSSIEDKLYSMHVYHAQGAVERKVSKEIGIELSKEIESFSEKLKTIKPALDETNNDPTPSSPRPGSGA